MVDEPNPLLTVGEIRRRAAVRIKARVGLHQIEYVLRKRGIQPSGRAGNALIYTDADLDYIVTELKKIRAEREGGYHA